MAAASLRGKPALRAPKSISAIAGAPGTPTGGEQAFLQRAAGAARGNRRSARLYHPLLDHGVPERGAVDLLVAGKAPAGVDDDALGQLIYGGVMKRQADTVPRCAGWRAGARPRRMPLPSQPACRSSSRGRTGGVLLDHRAVEDEAAGRPARPALGGPGAARHTRARCRPFCAASTQPPPWRQLRHRLVLAFSAAWRRVSG